MDMENTRLTGNYSRWKSIATHPMIVSITLLILCVGLHHSTLSGGWRFDDGPHLYFVALYSPWQYFFVPEILQQQSWAHITPWNAFFYEIGLPFFGLESSGHYAHLLLILWLVSVATFFFLRLWLIPLAALMGATLFLTMPATGAIGQMLMTGHYAYGLLFTILALYFFVRAVREQKLVFSILAASFYALACLCKELYVPIIMVLLFLPESHWRIRLHYLWPFFIVALVYSFFRIWVLQGIGGYDNSPITGIITAANVARGFVTNLFGSEWSWRFIIGYLCISFTITVFAQKKAINFPFLIMILIVLFVPIASMMKVGFNDAVSARLLFLISWGIAVSSAWLVSLNRWHTPLVFIIAIVLAFSQQKTINEVIGIAKMMEQQNHFMISVDQGSMLLPIDYNYLHYLDMIGKASTILTSNNPPIFLRDEESLTMLGEEIGAEVHQFDSQCECIMPIGKKYYLDRVNNFRSQIRAGSEEFLNVHFEIQDHGLKKIFFWKISSSSEGLLKLYIREYGMLEMPSQGNHTFGLDTTGPKQNLLHLYVHLESNKGWIARTPILTINPNTTNQVSWSGKSAIDWKAIGIWNDGLRDESAEDMTNSNLHVMRLLD